MRISVLASLSHVEDWRDTIFLSKSNLGSKEKYGMRCWVDLKPTKKDYSLYQNYFYRFLQKNKVRCPYKHMPKRPSFAQQMFKIPTACFSTRMHPSHHWLSHPFKYSHTVSYGFAGPLDMLKKRLCNINVWCINQVFKWPHR